jgi:GT2 family glycosyltransferase
MNYPKVSVITVNWNGYEDTIECLESLKKITYPNYDVVIVDNASSGDDVKILNNRYGDHIHIIANEQNYGFPGGCNIGMRYALSNGAEYLLLLNNDTIVDPEFLTELVKVAESQSSIGIVGSKIYYYHHPESIESAGGRIRWWLGHIENYGKVEDVGQWDEVAERDFVYGISLLIKKNLIDQISFMDTYFFFSIDDCDYCTKAKRAGFKVVYAPNSKVWHKKGGSSSKLPEFSETKNLIKKSQGWLKYKYFYRFFRRYCPPALFIVPFVLQVTLLGSFLFFLSHGDFKTIRIGTAKRLKSLFGRAR